MKRSKKIFIGAAILFFCFLVGIIYDMSSRTTFPGSKKAPKQDVQDTTKSTSSPKSTTQQP